MFYCANDVRATLEVLKAVFPIYLKMFPNPVTLSGMLEMGNMYLPVNENWLQYIQNCESAHEDMEHISTNSLIKAANETCSYYHNEK
jgi:DNA polymerase gamma 1